MMLAQRYSTAFGLPLILIGGWMAGQPGMLIAAPFVIACGLIGGGLLRYARSPRELRWTVHAGFAIAALLGVGAWQQWQAGSIMGTMAIGFAAAMVLSSLAAGLPRTSIEHGMVLVRLLAFVSAGYAYAQAASGVTRTFGLLSLNPNALAGFLLVVSMHWLAAEHGSRRSVLGSFVLLMAATFTGSRWAMLALCILLAYISLRRVISIKAFLVLMLVPLTFAMMIVADYGRFSYTTAAQAVSTQIEDATAKVDSAQPKTEVGAQLSEPSSTIPSLMPKGFLGPLHFGDGGHNTFHRVAVEAGWVGLVLFAGITAFAFIRSRGAVRIGIVALMLLGIADYYIWGPFQLAPLLWAFYGLSAQQAEA